MTTPRTKICPRGPRCGTARRSSQRPADRRSDLPDRCSAAAFPTRKEGALILELGFAFGLWRASRAAFLRFDVGAEDGVHAGEVALAVGLEPLDHVAVEPQMNGGFAGGQDGAGGFPEIVAEGFGARGVGEGLVEATGADGFDFAKKMSRDCHL